MFLFAERMVYSFSKGVAVQRNFGFGRKTIGHAFTCAHHIIDKPTCDYVTKKSGLFSSLKNKSEKQVTEKPKILNAHLWPYLSRYTSPDHK